MRVTPRVATQAPSVPGLRRSRRAALPRPVEAIAAAVDSYFYRFRTGQDDRGASVRAAGPGSLANVASTRTMKALRAPS